MEERKPRPNRELLDDWVRELELEEIRNMEVKPPEKEPEPAGWIKRISENVIANLITAAIGTLLVITGIAKAFGF